MGHHFKTVVMVIIGIKSESTARGRALLITIGAILSRIIMLADTGKLLICIANKIQYVLDIMSLKTFLYIFLSQISVRFTTSIPEGNGNPSSHVFIFNIPF